MLPDAHQGAVRQLSCPQRLRRHAIQLRDALAPEPSEWAERLVDADALKYG